MTKLKKLGSNQYETKYRKELTYKAFRNWTIFLSLAFLLLLIGMYYYENVYKAPLFNPLVEEAESYYDPQIVTASERRSTTSAVIDLFFAEHNSPLEGLGIVFYDTATKHGFPVYLLPAVSMAESSGGIHYIYSTNNFMGWGRGKIVFESKADCIEKVGYKISTLSYYRDFMANPEDIGEFSLSYNKPEAQVYNKTIRRFMDEIKSYEMKL
jgi:hypothetical protein